MKNIISRTIFLVFIWAMGSVAFAASYYVCSCDVGANSACVAGNDSNNGTSTSSPWQTIAKANAKIQNTSAGDQILFCRGGVWPAGGNLNWGNAVSTATSANPLILDGYTAAWGSTVRPILQFTGTGLYMGSYNTQQGVTIRNLDLRGPNIITNTVGINVYNNISYVTVDNVNIQGFHYGMQIYQQASAATSHDAVVQNSSFVNNRNIGLFTNFANVLIQNNTFTNNGNCAGGFDDGHDDGSGLHTCYVANQRHSLYVGGEGDGSTKNVTLRGNISTQASYFTGACEGTHITSHGTITGLLVENNIVYETSANGGCYGIGYGDNYGQTNEGVTGAVYRGNTVVNVGNQYFTFNAEPGVIVENNVAINTGVSNGGYGDAFTATGRNNSTSLQATNFTFRNNSAYYASGTGGNAQVFSLGPASSTTGTANVVANNLLYVASGSSANCYNINGKSPGDFANWDYNMCFNAGGGSPGGANTPYSGAQAHGLTSNPLLVSVPSAAPWSMAIQSTSPARGAGSVSLCAATDKTGMTRGSSCDIGAYQISASPVPPAPPISILVQ